MALIPLRSSFPAPRARPSSTSLTASRALLALSAGLTSPWMFPKSSISSPFRKKLMRFVLRSFLYYSLWRK
ncbi:hypothetical protein glysoja_043808 [Glycine soja]|uniref:Uncharacterized protein n=1 Tax=Glycine soja TaxID=3848 RepID=A0A0B2RU83_GLYSO|nr:hypothetical protein glysoja_043808 [Glycine soja]